MKLKDRDFKQSTNANLEKGGKKRKKEKPCLIQGLRASSLQFTSPLEFNAIFRDGFPLRLDLNGWSKIRDHVTAKFKHTRLL